MLKGIIDICKNVGSKLGKGFSETVYQEGISLLLRKSNLDYSTEVVLPILYDNINIGNVRADIILPTEQIIIECKAIDGNLKPSHIPQLINYLEITKYPVGILINFNQNPNKDIIDIITIERINLDLYKANLQNDKIIHLTNKGNLIKNECNDECN